LRVTKTVPRASTGSDAHWLGVSAWPSSQTANRAVGTILNDCEQIWKVTASRCEAATMTRSCCATKSAAGTAMGLDVARTSLILFVTSPSGEWDPEEEEEVACDEMEKESPLAAAAAAAGPAASGERGDGGAPPTPPPLAPLAAAAAAVGVLEIEIVVGKTGCLVVAADL
jgi:hypothetical protein